MDDGENLFGGLEVRERWFGGREMGLWVLRERKRDFGWGAAMDDGEKKNSEKLDFDGMCLSLLFYL